MLLLAMSGSLATPTLSQAQEAQPDVAQAEDFAAQAFDAYSSKEYARAVALYQQAFAAAPSADILYNIARIYEVGLRDRQLAMAFYRRYVADPGAEPERIQSANERLQELRAAEAAAVSPASNPSEQAGAAPTAVEPGIDQPATQQPSNAPSTGSALRTAGWVLTAVGVAGLAVGAGFGAAALSDAEIVSESCDGDLCRSQAAVDAAEAGTTKAAISTTGFIAGGALLASGVVMLVLYKSEGDSPDRTPAKLQLRPAPGFAGAAAVLSGQW